MEKPLSVLREEFVDDLVNLVNSSHLPLFVVLDVLKAAKDEVELAAKKQYEADKKAYEEAQKANEEPNT